MKKLVHNAYKSLMDYIDFTAPDKESNKKYQELLSLIYVKLLEQDKANVNMIFENAKLRYEKAELCEKVYLLSNKIYKLEKENTELKKDKDYFSENLDKQVDAPLNVIKQLNGAKELLKQWLQTSNASGCDNINLIADTQNFLKE